MRGSKLLNILLRSFYLGFTVNQMDVNFNSCSPDLHDEVAERLRRWTANPLGSARVGSNPILVDGSMV